MITVYRCPIHDLLFESVKTPDYGPPAVFTLESGLRVAHPDCPRCAEDVLKNAASLKEAASDHVNADKLPVVAPSPAPVFGSGDPIEGKDTRITS